MKSILLSFFLFFASALQSQDMTNARMGAIIQKEATQIKGTTGAWQFMYGGHLLLVITDSLANRMRIFSPVIETKDLRPGQTERMLIANFDSALDAKYGIYEGLVVSIFTHPLKQLTEAQFVDAMRQVATLASTFGTTYQSTDLIFNGGQQKEEPKINESPKREKKN
ncbi:MAG TPA: hypothetical protein ENJ20_02540 [Bacteroidetes bacterium]|nr:hypothetical protein [Bacteroidota bacterium]